MLREVPGARPPEEHCVPKPNDAVALVLGGGGARGAYQAGVLRAIARRKPALNIPILTGISAGALNMAFLASHPGSMARATEDLVALWLSIVPERVFDVNPGGLLANVFRWGSRLLSGGLGKHESMRGLVETTPLRSFLRTSLASTESDRITGIEENIASGRLRAIALSATSYSTGQSVTWVQGNDVSLWQRPQRRSELARLSVEHVMASAALPLLFPAVRVGDEWYGDGGIRLTAPLSPALHLGATRILTISTRYQRSRAEADESQIAGYPPPAQVLGVLYNAIFLDLIDQDIVRLELMNELLRQMPPEKETDLSVVDILVLRPSQDLGRLSSKYEPRLPSFFRFLSRGLGTTKTASPDILSLVMFQRDYIEALVKLGESDAEAQWDRIDRFLEPGIPSD